MDTWWRWVADAATDAAAFLLPVACAGCGVDDVPLCEACRAALRPRPLVRELPGGVRVHSALAYEGVAARVLRTFKQEGRTSLARPLGAALRTAAVTAGVRGPVVYVPVPTSRAAMRRRGYRVVDLLLRRAGLPTAPLLRAVRDAGDQRALGRRERAVNVAGTLAAPSAAAGRRVVVVDDVVTTGATLAEAVRALRAAGADPVAAVTVAATPQRVANA